LAIALIAAMATAVAPGAAHAEGRVLVLSDEDADAYRVAFAAVDAGDLAAAQDALDHVADQSLKGHVLARAFLKPGANPTYKALVAWLRAFPDLPYGDLIRARAALKRPADAPPEPAPQSPGSRRMPHAGGAPPGDTASARQALADAADRFAAGDLAGAAALARDQRNGPRAGPAAWQLGLIAFKTGSFDASAAMFDAAASWPYWDGWHAAASRYWAGRAHLAAGHPREALERYRSALAYPQTFYGQLAEAQLGRSSGLEFTPPTLDSEDARSFLSRHSEARRAAALAQIGRLSDVEQELRLLHARLGPDEDRVFLDFADALAAPSAQLRAAEYGGPSEGWGYCPTMSFAPSNGFQLDRAALFAVTRQESRYSPVAVSSTNARGLMQLLASTATDMDPSKPYRARPEMLDDPGLNMRLGQSYLQWLMRQAAPDGDLMKLFAAYNGGPGWLTRWLAANPGDARDSLMMIESLPRAESRDYAERVLSHMGLCRKRFGQESAEFDELASGKPALYVRLDR
jgi:soluble lytic murein transglycosylase-like protein